MTGLKDDDGTVAMVVVGMMAMRVTVMMMMMMVVVVVLMVMMTKGTLSDTRAQLCSLAETWSQTKSSNTKDQYESSLEHEAGGDIMKGCRRRKQVHECIDCCSKVSLVRRLLAVAEVTSCSFQTDLFRVAFFTLTHEGINNCCWS